MGRTRKAISTNQLAKLLRRFHVSPGVIRVGEETARGYLLADFTEAFARYLPDYPLPECNSVTLPQHQRLTQNSECNTPF
jgi:hypothetical protein